MARLYGVTQEWSRDLIEIRRRVLTAGMGRAKRQRWPVGGVSSGTKFIRFRFIDFVGASEVTANCLVLGSSNGRLLGETVQVTDGTDEGCFFADETEGELEDRNGYAVWMKYIVDESLMTTAWRWEVPSLCCPPEGS